MFDLGWGELLLIGVIALIVVGPKDMPAMFRTLGRYTGRMRGMARDFQRAMNQAAEESGVREVAREIKSTTDSSDMGLDALDNVAKRVKSTLGTSPGKLMATSAGLSAANIIKDKKSSQEKKPSDDKAPSDTLTDNTPEPQDDPTEYEGDAENTIDPGDDLANLIDEPGPETTASPEPDVSDQEQTAS